MDKERWIAGFIAEVKEQFPWVNIVDAENEAHAVLNNLGNNEPDEITSYVDVASAKWEN